MLRYPYKAFLRICFVFTLFAMAFAAWISSGKDLFFWRETDGAKRLSKCVIQLLGVIEKMLIIN
jgi:hypothetical protein